MYGFSGVKISDATTGLWDGSFIWYLALNGAVTEKMRLNASGQLLINTTSAIGSEKLRVNGDQYIDDDLTVDNVTLTEGQIVFPATQNASSNANTLDDYEEGTYEPTITCETSGSYTLQSNQNTLAYIKIGSLVHIQGHVNIESENSPSGYLLLSLPFTVTSGTEASSLNIGNANVYDSGSAYDRFGISKANNPAFANLIFFASSGYYDRMTEAHVDTAWQLTIDYNYIAAN
jgi:hypothetical protein